MKTIPLTKGAKAIVDDQDYEWLNQWNWQLSKSGYAIRRERIRGGKTRTIRMHRVVCKTPEGSATDHVNGDRTDNRRCNLRVATNGENAANSHKKSTNATGFKGVSWCKRRNLFGACMSIAGKTKWIGFFPTAEEAGEAYRNAHASYWGQFSRI